MTQQPHPKYTPKRTGNIHAKTYTNIHSSIIQNSQNVVTTQMPINW